MSLDKENVEKNVVYASLKGPRFKEIRAAFGDTSEDVLLEKIEFRDYLYICLTKQPEGIVDEISLFLGWFDKFFVSAQRKKIWEHDFRVR